MTKLETLVINAETVIVNLLEKDKKEYVTLERLESLIGYIHEQLIERDLLNLYQDIVFNINFEAIERTVLYNNMVFELRGNRIYKKQSDIPDEVKQKCANDSNIKDIIETFEQVA